MGLVWPSWMMVSSPNLLCAIAMLKELIYSDNGVLMLRTGAAEASWTSFQGKGCSIVLG